MFCQKNQDNFFITSKPSKIDLPILYGGVQK